MRFGLVPKAAKQARPWAPAVTIGPPTGREDTVSAVEAQVDEQTELGRAFRMFVYPTQPELELLRAGQPIEFSVYAAQLVPVSAQVTPAIEEHQPAGHHLVHSEAFVDQNDPRSIQPACAAHLAVWSECLLRAGHKGDHSWSQPRSGEARA